MGESEYGRPAVEPVIEPYASEPLACREHDRAPAQVARVVGGESKPGFPELSWNTWGARRFPAAREKGLWT